MKSFFSFGYLVISNQPSRTADSLPQIQASSGLKALCDVACVWGSPFPTHLCTFLSCASMPHVAWASPCSPQSHTPTSSRSLFQIGCLPVRLSSRCRMWDLLVLHSFHSVVLCLYSLPSPSLPPLLITSCVEGAYLAVTSFSPINLQCWHRRGMLKAVPSTLNVTQGQWVLQDTLPALQPRT